MADTKTTHWSRCPKCKKYIPAALSITEKRPTKRCRCGDNRRVRTYADMSHPALLKIGPYPYRRIDRGPIHENFPMTSFPARREGAVVARAVEMWEADDVEVRRKEDEIYRQHKAFAIYMVRGVFDKMLVRMDISEKKREMGKMATIIEMGKLLLVESSQYREEVDAAKSAVSCREHERDICYCVAYPWKVSKGVKEVRWMDIRSRVLNWPRSRLPLGVKVKDESAAERGEECPEDGQNECYCVAFFAKEQRMLVDIKPTVLRAKELGVLSGVDMFMAIEGQRKEHSDKTRDF